VYNNEERGIEYWDIGEIQKISWLIFIMLCGMESKTKIIF